MTTRVIRAGGSSAGGKRKCSVVPRGSTPPPATIWKCQFCEREYPDLEWIGCGNKCPACGKKYDALLAQDSEEVKRERD